MQKEKKNNFTNGNVLNLSYYDVDFFGVPSEKNTHILLDKWYFIDLILINVNVSTITSTINLIKDSRKSSYHIV